MTVCAVCLYFLAKVSPGLSAFLIGGLFVIWSWGLFIAVPVSNFLYFVGLLNTVNSCDFC
jgi:hypothetical protein